MANNSYVYFGMEIRRGGNGRQFKVGETSQPLFTREYQIQQSGHSNFEILYFVETANKTKAERLFAESIIRRELSKKYGQTSIDWFKANVSNDEIYTDVENAFELVAKLLKG